MTGGVRIAKRIVQNIGIAIKGLGVAGIRHNRIRAGKPAHAGQVVTGVVVDEAQVVVVLLSGVASVCKGLSGFGAVAAEEPALNLSKGQVAGAAAGNHTPGAGVTHDTVIPHAYAELAEA